jgi:GTPase SAR1 family protein
VSSMQAILDAFGYVKNPPELNDELKECKDVVQKFSFEDEECEVPLFIQSAIEKLWNSLPVKALLERRSEFWCLDGVDYYFNNLCRFVDPNFEPEEEDCVLARIITTGIVTTGFSTPCALHRELQLKYTIIDVGGQRNERRKWIHCFDDVSVILYVVNLAGYQTVLYEDHSVNRLLESLDVFKDTLNNEIFSQTHIFLLLNKKDLFENLIRKKPLSNLFPEYEGGDDVQKALSYIENKYKSLLVKNPERMSTFVISARVKLDMKNSWYEIDSFIQDKYRHNFRDALKGREKLEKEKKRLKLTK